MNSPFEKLDVDTRGEWLELHTTQAFLGTIRSLRQQIVDGAVESMKAGTIDERTIAVIGGELRSLDQLLAIATRKAPRG